MTLKELIEALEKLPQTAVVRNGFGKPMSHRGSFDEVAFDPEERATISDMLRHAKSALGATFSGYKGGAYIMGPDSNCVIAAYGQAVEDFVSESTILDWKGQIESNSTLEQELKRRMRWRPAATCANCAKHHLGQCRASVIEVTTNLGFTCDYHSEIK